MPDVAEDEREEMRQYIEDLTHRRADKLDNIISILKSCDMTYRGSRKRRKRDKRSKRKMEKESQDDC